MLAVWSNLNESKY